MSKVKSKKQKILLTFIFIFGTISLGSLYLLNSKGVFGEYHFKELECKKSISIPGVEDFSISSAGFMFLASQDRVTQIYDRKWPNGNLYAVDLETSKTFELKTMDLAHDFHPRTLSVYESNGRTTIFVANYLRDGFSVEKFSWDQFEFKHIKSIHSHHLKYPAAIAAIDHDTFYIINEHGLYTDFGHWIENFFGLSLSQVLFFNGQKINPLPFHFKRAYGMALNSEKKTLYVSDISDRSIFSFDIDGPHLQLKEMKSLEVSPAHLTLDLERNKIWVASHPFIFHADSYAGDPQNIIAPTHVSTLQADFRDQKLQTVYFSSSGLISAASKVIRWKNLLYLGSGFSGDLVSCNYN